MKTKAKTRVKTKARTQKTYKMKESECEAHYILDNLIRWGIIHGPDSYSFEDAIKEIKDRISKGKHNINIHKTGGTNINSLIYDFEGVVKSLKRARTFLEEAEHEKQKDTEQDTVQVFSFSSK